MISQKLELINEQKSPLFRIMWVYNVNDPIRKQFQNNICAFHIGNGFVLSVAHNLRTESGVISSIDNSIFESEIIPVLNPMQKQLLEQLYVLDPSTNKRYLNISDPHQPKIIAETFKQINYDTRWITLNEKNICKPYLIVQFAENKFYQDDTLTGYFSEATNFHEPSLNRQTFLIELELVEGFYSNDIALYKIVNTEKSIIDRLPSIEIDFGISDDNELNYYCLQSAPVGNLGRLLNIAHIEGFLDHHSTFHDKIGGNYIMEGTRYLIKGYFRFGSSGAPYVIYDYESAKFKVNSIQSEASPLQLSINNNREGNFQYVNAIASPLKNIEWALKQYF